MGSSLEYRQREIEARKAAQSADLPRVVARHREAAERWQMLADEAERIEGNRRRGLKDIFY